MLGEIGGKSEEELCYPVLVRFLFSFFILSIVFGVLFVSPVPMYAAYSFSPTIWQENKDVTVNGADLEGDYPSERLLCFAPESDPDDLKCFRPDSKSIKQWTQTTIVFTPAANTPPVGFLKVFIMEDTDLCTNAGCQIVKQQKEIVVGSYKAHPYIIDVLDSETGVKAGNITRGKTYKIKGFRFGDETHEIYFGIRRIAHEDILGWTHSEIIFRPSQEYEASDGMRVQTAAAKSNIFSVNIVDSISNDPHSHLQFHLSDMGITDAWKQSQGKGIVVAVIDSGVDTNHAEFRGRIWNNPDEIRGNGKDDDGNGYVDDIDGWNFVSDASELTPTSSHGTAVAGVIAAAKDNGVGVAGIAPQTVIMPLIVSRSDGKIVGEDVNEAIRYAVDNGANIINLSMGGPGFTTDFSPLFTSSIQYAAERNALVIIAAGNGDVIGQQSGNAQGVDLDQNPKSPVCNRTDKRWSIGVAAIGRTDEKSRFSDFGLECIDLAALGEDVVTTSFYALSEGGANYASVSGTSFSTPIVSGLAALVWASKPTLAAWQVRDILIRSGDPLDDPTVGRKPDIIAAFTEAGRTTPKSPLKPTTPTVPPEVSGTLFPDVPSAYPYEPAIRWGKETKVLQGYPDGTFRPDRTVNRAEFLKIVLEADPMIDVSKETKRTGFPDVDESAWYAPYIRYARRTGIIEGYPDGYFRPEQTVNVAEALKISYRALNVATIDTGGEWFRRYLTHAQYNGILFSNDIDVASNMQRKDVLWVVWKLMGGK